MELHRLELDNINSDILIIQNKNYGYGDVIEIKDSLWVMRGCPAYYSGDTRRVVKINKVYTDKTEGIKKGWCILKVSTI